MRLHKATNFLRAPTLHKNFAFGTKCCSDRLRLKNRRNCEQTTKNWRPSLSQITYIREFLPIIISQGLILPLSSKVKVIRNYRHHIALEHETKQEREARICSLERGGRRARLRRARRPLRHEFGGAAPPRPPPLFFGCFLTFCVFGSELRHIALFIFYCLSLNL